MRKVNMLEAKTNLSRLVQSLETGAEDMIHIARNGTPVAQLTLIRSVPAAQRIGIAKGKFTVPDDFDRWDEEIAHMFGGSE